MAGPIQERNQGESSPFKLPKFSSNDIIVLANNRLSSYCTFIGNPIFARL